jgi:hypothetical protein
MRLQSVGWIVLAATATLLVSGCSRKQDNPANHDAEIAGGTRVEPAAIAATTRLVQADVDAIPSAISQLLSSLAAAGPSTSDQLTINYEGQSIPVDWWLWRAGLIELKGLDPARQPILGISSQGLSLISKPPTWFNLVATPDPSSTCQATDSVTAVKCDLKIVYAVAVSPQAAAFLGKSAPLPMTVSDTVTSDGKVWAADAVDYGTDGPPGTSILNAILGPAADRDSERQQYITQIAAKTSGYTPAPPNQ